MSGKKERSIGMKVLASVSSITLIVCLVILIFAEVSITTGIVAALAFGGLAVPAVAAGDTALSCISGIFELFLEGIAAIFEVIAGAFSGF